MHLDNVPFNDEDQNRLSAERRNGDAQKGRWQYCTLDRDLENLELEAVHDFCWKVCAVYMLFPEQFREEHYLCEFLDSKWFQGVKTPVFAGSFFAKGIHLTSARELLQIMELHRNVCDQVTSRQGTLSPQDAAEHGQKDAELAQTKNNFWSHAATTFFLSLDASLLFLMFSTNRRKSGKSWLTGQISRLGLCLHRIMIRLM
ncbi:hypothetical protein BDV12DRAFT_200896 [Aspergillus spectabilis]